MNKLQALCAALLLALANTGAAAAETKMEVRVGLGEKEFQAAHAQMLNEGLRLTDLTVSEVAGKPVIGAIWEHFDGAPAASPERTKQLMSMLYLKKTREELQAIGERLGPTGSQLEVIDAYVSNGKPVFAASFSLPNEPTVATVGVFLTDEQVQGMRADALSHDYDFRRMEVYLDDDLDLYLPSFVPRLRGEFEGVDGESTLQFMAESAKMVFLEREPLSICSYEDGKGHAFYSGMFDDSPRNRDVVVGKTLAEIRAKIEPLLAKGGIVLDIDTHAAYGEVVYSAVLQNP